MSTEYFTEIESHFAQRRGTPFVLSAKDWVLMKSWNDEGIPLPIVIEAIDAVFDKHDAKGKKVNGLAFCKHAVKELWRDRRELQIGSEDGAPEADLASRLDALAQTLEEAAPPFAVRVRELVSEKSAPRIEERLIELEEELVEALASPELRDEARALSATVGEKTRARTENAHLRRLVRERYALPRLTLF